MNAGNVHTFAALDIGSNSIKLLVAGYDTQGAWRVLVDQQKIAGLGRGMHASGEISEEAMVRNQAVIAGHLAVAREHGVQEYAAVGTMCLRTARNAGEFVARVQQESGLTIEVIPGEEEARLSYLGALSSLGRLDGRIAIFDIGGGSTEFIFGQDEQITERYSLTLGAIRLLEEHLLSDPFTLAEQERMLAAIDTALEKLGGDHAIDTLVGIGGTITNLSAVKQHLEPYDPERIEGSTLSRDEVQALLDLFRACTVADRKQLKGLEPQRADVIPAGTGIALKIMERLAVDKVTVSDHGVRHGLMFDRFQSRAG